MDSELELREAAASLERSIAEEPSEKARYFLDEVRKRRMKLEDAAVSAPAIRVGAASAIVKADGSFATAALPVVVSGTAEDPLYVSSVEIEGVPLFLEGSSRSVRFQKRVDLPEGEHVVEVEVANLLGGKIKRALRIKVGRSSPVIVLESFVYGVELRGRVFDESAVASLSADGRPLAVPSGEDGVFSVPLSPGKRSVVLRVTDELGNDTVANVGAEHAASMQTSGLFAANEETTISDADGGVFQGSVRRPEIHRHGWPAEETVFVEAMEVAGRVEGMRGLVSLSISVSNDRRQDVLEMRMEYEKPVSGRTFFFDRVVPLHAGRNMVMFQSADAINGRATKTLRIVRRIPGAFRTEHRYALGVYPFDDTEKRGRKTVFDNTLGALSDGRDRSRFLTYAERRMLLARLLGDMAGRRRFRTVPKESPARSAQTSSSGYVGYAKDADRNLSEKTGERADALLFGNTAKDRHGVEIVARVVDVRTSEIMATVDAFSGVCTEAALASMADRLCEKIHRAFPLSVGAVLEVVRGTAQADFETEEKISPGWPMILFRPTAPRFNPVTRVCLGSDARVLGDAAMGENGVVVLNSSSSKPPVPGDGVVCR